jgi:FMN-dependent oxidoreductase (nitrilotriacetate monooxygenase family)
VEHDKRYQIADEYLDVLYKLWEGSWDDDAVLIDRDKNVYTDPAKVRYINHVGERFSVAGPHLSQPSPQRTPVLFQAGSSTAGMTFAAKHAEVVFVGGHDLVSYRDNVAQIRALAVKNGRAASDIKAYAMAVVIVGRTREEAERKAAVFERLSRPGGYLAHAGGGGVDLAAYPPSARMVDVLAAEKAAGREHSRRTRFYAPSATVGEALGQITRFDRPPFFAIGTPTEVVDEIERWVRDTDLDGFNLRQFLSPGTAEDFIELVVPELQRRGLYRTQYEEPTLRERLFGAGHTRLPDSHFGARYRGGAHLDDAVELADVGRG